MFPSRVKLGLGVDVSLGSKCKKWTPNYTGAGHVRIPEWHAARDLDIEIYYYLDNESTVRRMTLGWTAASYVYGFYHLGDNPEENGVYARFQTKTNGAVMLHSNGFLEQRIVRLARFSRRGTTCSFYIDDVLQSTLELRGTIGLDVIGAGTVNYNIGYNWPGKIWAVSLTDFDNQKNSRHYSSVISSRGIPTSKFLIDELCEWRKNDWVLRFYKRVLKIPKWVAGKDGDGVSFKFMLTTLDSDSHITDAIDRNYIVAEKSRNLSFNTKSNVLDVVINGNIYNENEFKLQVNTLYFIEITYKKGTSIEFFGGRYVDPYGIYCMDGFVFDIRLDTENDKRHYACIIRSERAPTTSIIIDSISGKDAEFIPFISGIKKDADADALSMENKNNVKFWTNELSTDGEMIGFGENLWTEL